MIIGVEFLFSARYELRTKNFFYIIEAWCVYWEVWIKAEERIEHKTYNIKFKNQMEAFW